jgi:hypothetical protein
LERICAAEGFEVVSGFVDLASGSWPLRIVPAWPALSMPPAAWVARSSKGMSLNAIAAHLN